MKTTRNDSGSVFRPGKFPSLNRLPEELGRGERPCEACAKATTHILYRVPKKVVFLYLKDHPENVHATCIECAHSEILAGEDRERVLSRVEKHEGSTG